MENLRLYNQVRECPEEALKEIKGGKLQGKSDINPIWRIKKLTELFGPAGIGWKAPIIQKWTENGAGGEVAAFVDIELYVKQDGQWSEAIQGTGGSMLVTTEKGKLVTNDEAFKMAYTDAISVACKALGFAADVYWDNDKTKYPTDAEPESPDQTLENARKWLKAAKYSSADGLRIIQHECAESPSRLEDATKEQLTAMICWIKNALIKKKEQALNDDNPSRKNY